MNMRFVKPLDQALLGQMAEQSSLLVTLEDNAVQGGAGSAVNEFLLAEGYAVPVMNFGIPDRYIEHAQREEQIIECGLDAPALIQAIQQSYAGIRQDFPLSVNA